MALAAPLAGKLTVTSRFGKRPQVPGTKADTTNHLGTDLRAPVGTPCLAPADGVVYAFRQSGRYYGPRIFTSALAGNWIVTWHPSLGIYVNYAHMQGVDVALGAPVKTGQQVGRTGNTGGVAPHLHAGIWTRIGNTWTAHDPESFFDFTGKATTPATPQEDFMAPIDEERFAALETSVNTLLTEFRTLRPTVEATRGDQTYAEGTRSRAERIQTLAEGSSAKVDELHTAILGLGNGKYSWLDRIRSVMNTLEQRK